MLRKEVWDRFCVHYLLPLLFNDVAFDEDADVGMSGIDVDGDGLCEMAERSVGGVVGDFERTLGTGFHRGVGVFGDSATTTSGNVEDDEVGRSDVGELEGVGSSRFL